MKYNKMNPNKRKIKKVYIYKYFPFQKIQISNILSSLSKTSFQVLALYQYRVLDQCHVT